MSSDGKDSTQCKHAVSMAPVFFHSEGLQRILTYLCNARLPGAWDPVTSTVLDLLTGRLQFCLTAEGLVPFKGKATLVYPYHMMTQEQKTFLREAISDRARFCICNDALMFHACEGDPERLDHVDVLEAMCSRILASNVHGDYKVRVGVCNIILQRIQSTVTITRNVQQRLNEVLFGPQKQPDQQMLP